MSNLTDHEIELQIFRIYNDIAATIPTSWCDHYVYRTISFGQTPNTTNHCHTKAHCLPEQLALSLI